MARKHRKALASDVKAVFAAPTKDWALAAASGVVERWSASHPGVASGIEDAR